MEEYDQKYLWYETRDYKIFKAVHRQDRLCDLLIKEYKPHVEVDKIHFEKEILNSLRGKKNFIQLLDSYTSTTAYNLVLENCHFTLQQYSDNTHFKDKTIADITFELFEAVRQLNNNNVYLLNLRPENVWVQVDPHDNTCTFKITDFLDSVRESDPTLRPISDDDQLEFAAPETYQKKGIYPLTKADIYSIGKILECLKFKEPCLSCKLERKSDAQKQAEYQSMNCYLKDIIERAREESPTRRANLFMIHVLFKEYYKSDFR